MWNVDTVKDTVSKHKLVCFAKGSRQQPMCGFSARAIQILEQLEKPFEVVNIFDDPSIRPALVEASNWPTTPQVFLNGELLGGSDILLEMYQSGDLQKQVESAFAG
ncbi:MAG: Grx4 family monothiol glutaredoxin [Planctomycetota bacterium]